MLLTSSVYVVKMFMYTNKLYYNKLQTDKSLQKMLALNGINLNIVFFLQNTLSVESPKPRDLIISKSVLGATNSSKQTKALAWKSSILKEKLFY